jgi:hypothetical protein
MHTPHVTEMAQAYAMARPPDVESGLLGKDGALPHRWTLSQIAVHLMKNVLT